jgi:hypothetical protein
MVSRKIKKWGPVETYSIGVQSMSLMPDVYSTVVLDIDTYSIIGVNQYSAVNLGIEDGVKLEAYGKKNSK